MIKFNEIALDYEPREKIIPKLLAEVKIPVPRAVLTSDFDLAFLCGLLRKFQPKKIVDVGLAYGGSTATILQCLEDIGQKYIMHSIDTGEKAFKNGQWIETACLVKYAKENNLISGGGGDTHHFHLGTVLPNVIEEIGGDIDFVFLDTLHVLPSEILDFLAVLPYLKDGAIVALHDIRYGQRFKIPEGHATTALFSAVVADKFLNYEPEQVDLIYTYPNIAAFQINEQTRANIENVFLTLVMRWKYLPSREQLRAYYDIYQKHYSPELCKLFEQALKMNYLNLRATDAIKIFQNGEIKI